MRRRKYVKNDNLPQTLPMLIKSLKETCPKNIAQYAKDVNGNFQEYSYESVYNEIIALAISLQKLGVEKNSHVALISDNRREWLLADLAVLSLGGADVPRGCDSTASEVSFIISHSEAKICFFETSRQLLNVLNNDKEISLLKKAIFFDMPTGEDAKIIEAKANEVGIKIYSFASLLEEGKKIITENPVKVTEIEKIMSEILPNDTATLIYTSGTTGIPKGVMLTHRNYIAQLETVHYLLPGKPNQKWLTVLPVWHSFERAIQYIVLTFQSALVYSKPVGQIMLADMAVIKPEMMCGVPRLW